MDLLTNLISYWKLDESSGDRADSQGTNTLTDNNTVASATGKINLGADFEAGNPGESLSHADNTSLSTGDIDFSVSCWIKVESFDLTGSIACKGDNLGDEAATEWALYVNSSNELHFRVGKNGSGFGDVAWSSTISTATWYHVVAWHDSVNNQVGIVVNAGTAATASWSAGVNDTTNPFYMGSDGSGDRQYDGLVDEFGFWKRVLTSLEISQLYNAGAGLPFSSFGASATPPLGSYTMNTNRLIRGV